MPGLGGSSAKTDRTTQLFSEGQAKDIGSFLKTLGPQLTAKGATDVNTGLADTGKASKYYSDILSGDPNKVLAAVQPEVNSITANADATKKTLATGSNRSGGSNATAQQVDDKSRGQITDTIAKAKPGAAAGLESTGSQVSGVGLQEQGQGIGASNSAASIFQNLINSSIQSRGQSAKLNSDATQQWAEVVGALLFGV
jgi:hypothetical protein